MYRSIVKGDYSAAVRFCSNDNGHFYGMGTYQMAYPDLKDARWNGNRETHRHPFRLYYPLWDMDSFGIIRVPVLPYSESIIRNGRRMP
ncbi:MAG: hypothetical protein ACI32N_08450 [Bulleidia sp.]